MLECTLFTLNLAKGGCSWVRSQAKPGAPILRFTMYMARIMFWDFVLTNDEINQIYNVSVTNCQAVKMT